MDLLAVLCLVFVALHLHYPGKGQWFRPDGLGKTHTDALKGFAAVFIVLGHLSLTVNAGILLPWLRQVGLFAVTVFFALSGYGLVVSYERSEYSLKNYWRKRVFTVVLPYAVFTVLYVIVRLLLGEQVTPASVALSFVNGTPVVKYSWFVETILLYYCAFYAAARLAGKDTSLLCFLMLLFTVGYVLVMKKLGFDSFWYNTALSFVIGMRWACRREAIAEALRTHGAVYIPGLWLLFGCFFYCTRVLWLWGELGEILVTSAFVIAVLALQYVFPARSCRVTRFLGDISFELYLSHGAILMLASRSAFLIAHPLCFGLTVYAGAIASGWLLHLAFRALRARLETSK